MLKSNKSIKKRKGEEMKKGEVVILFSNCAFDMYLWVLISSLILMITSFDEWKQKKQKWSKKAKKAKPSEHYTLHSTNLDFPSRMSLTSNIHLALKAWAIRLQNKNLLRKEKLMKKLK